MKPFFIAVFSIFFIGVAPAQMAVAHENNEEHTLEISDVWARKTRRTNSAAVYLRIHNPTEKGDTLLGANTERAAMTTLHMSGEEDGIMRMEMQDTVPVPAGETVHFEPGGLHIMMMRLSQRLTEGEVFPLVLSFENAGDVTVYVDVTGLSGLKQQ